MYRSIAGCLLAFFILSYAQATDLWTPGVRTVTIAGATPGDIASLIKTDCIDKGLSVEVDEPNHVVCANPWNDEQMAIFHARMPAKDQMGITDLSDVIDFSLSSRGSDVGIEGHLQVRYRKNGHIIVTENGNPRLGQLFGERLGSFKALWEARPH